MERGDLTGAILDGRYRVLEPVAEGAMGIVYRAERIKLGRIVAIKVLHDVLPHELSGRKRFEIEARAMAKLEHPHCASVLDVGVHGDRPFVVMEFVSGQNLKDLIATGAQPIPRATEIGRQVLSGLAHAHEHGIIHRDIKPANIVLSQKTGLGDHVKILDFGLARVHDAGQNLTAGIVVGTPAYMAPEQIRGWKLDGRADLYACGVLMFELLTGHKPFHSKNDDPIEVCKMHLHDPAPRLADLRTGVEFGGLEAVVAKALAKRTDDRFASAQEFAAAIDAVVPRRVKTQTLPPVPPSGPIQLASTDVEAIGDTSYPPSIEVRSVDVMSAIPADNPGASAMFEGFQTTGARAAIARRPLRRRIAVVAAIALAAGSAVAVLGLRSGAAPGEVAVASGSSSASAPDPVRDIAARATDLAGQGEREAALDLLARSRRQYPDSGVLAYTAGRLQFSKYYWTDGLKSFRDAIRSDPRYRTDPELIKTVLRGFITTPSYNDELAAFLRDEIGSAAQPYLEETARDHPSAAIRSRAASELRRYH